MSDQAETLRKLLSDSKGATQKRLHPIDVITITSGMREEGKSLAASSLGVLFSQVGHKVLLIDAGVGGSGLGPLLGQGYVGEIDALIEGRVNLKEALTEVRPGLTLLSLSWESTNAGIREEIKRKSLNDLIALFSGSFDTVIMDVGGDVSQHVQSLHSPNYLSVLSLSPLEGAVRTAARLMKKLRRSVGLTQIGVLVNQVTDAAEARSIYRELTEKESRKNDVRTHYLGFLPIEQKIRTAMRNEKNLLELSLGAPFLPCVRLFAKRLENMSLEQKGRGFVRQKFSDRFKDEPLKRSPRTR